MSCKFISRYLNVWLTIIWKDSNMTIYLCYYIDKDFGTYCRKQTRPPLMQIYTGLLMRLSEQNDFQSVLSWYRQTDDLDHFRQGFLVRSVVCVRIFHGIPLTRYTHLSFRPIAVHLPDTHQHSETHTAEHEHLVLHTNHRELWDMAGRSIPSHCSQLHGAGLTRITLQGLTHPAETAVYW